LGQQKGEDETKKKKEQMKKTTTKGTRRGWNKDGGNKA
jgi:hypothetical protein